MKTLTTTQRLQRRLPWWAAAVEHAEEFAELAEAFEVEGFPTSVIYGRREPVIVPGLPTVVRYSVHCRPVSLKVYNTLYQQEHLRTSNSGYMDEANLVSQLKVARVIDEAAVAPHAITPHICERAALQG
eukprot:6458649-Amphidinium_carterae.2